MAIIEALLSMAILLAETPVFLGLVILAVVVTGMLGFKRPTIDQQTVFSLVPWMVAAAALFVFADLAAYPEHLKPVLTENGAYLSMYALLGVAWVAMLETSVKPETNQLIPDYLGTMGLGIATILVAFTILQAGTLPTERIIYPLGIIVGSAAFATIMVFLLGTLFIDVLAYASKLSVLVLFSHSLDAVARVIGFVRFDSVGHSTMSWYVTDLTALAGTARGTQEFLISWGLTYITFKVGLAMFVILLLASHAREHPTRAAILFGIVAGLGVTSGVTNLLLIAIGGAL